MKFQPVYKGQLLEKGKFSGSLEWPFYTCLTVRTIRFYDDLKHVRSKSKDWETKSIKCPDTIYKVKPRYVEVQLIDKFTLKYPKVRDIRDKLKDSTNRPNVDFRVIRRNDLSQSRLRVTRLVPQVEKELLPFRSI
jgi:hypothetical protein